MKLAIKIAAKIARVNWPYDAKQPGLRCRRIKIRPFSSSLLDYVPGTNEANMDTCLSKSP